MPDLGTFQGIMMIAWESQAQMFNIFKTFMYWGEGGVTSQRTTSGIVRMSFCYSLLLVTIELAHKSPVSLLCGNPSHYRNTGIANLYSLPGSYMGS